VAVEQVVPMCRPVRMLLRFERIEADLSAIYNLDERRAGIQRDDGAPVRPPVYRARRGNVCCTSGIARGMRTVSKATIVPIYEERWIVI
jgi:hypothetical protein